MTIEKGRNATVRERVTNEYHCNTLPYGRVSALCKKLQYCFSIILLLSSAAISLAHAENAYSGLPNFHKVNERLYRGAQPQPKVGLTKLKELGIKTIINLRSADEKSQSEETEAKRLGLRYFSIPMERVGKPSDAQIEEVLSIINGTGNQPVFVHCKKGQDRTGTVLAIYRITHDNWTAENAINEAEKYGMKFWQSGMKNYIKDYAKRKGKPE